jgi:hypothetical protein
MPSPKFVLAVLSRAHRQLGRRWKIPLLAPSNQGLGRRLFELQLQIRNATCLKDTRPIFVTLKRALRGRKDQGCGNITSAAGVMRIAKNHGAVLPMLEGVMSSAGSLPPIAAVTHAAVSLSGATSVRATHHSFHISLASPLVSSDMSDDVASPPQNVHRCSFLNPPPERPYDTESPSSPTDPATAILPASVDVRQYRRLSAHEDCSTAKRWRRR